jgi:hypothetical protein
MVRTKGEENLATPGGTQRRREVLRDSIRAQDKGKDKG